MNAHRLQQDHPCVIEIIRRKYLHHPSPPEALSLSHPEVVDPSAGQSATVLPYLKNKVRLVNICMSYGCLCLNEIIVHIHLDGRFLRGMRSGGWRIRL